MGSYSHPAAPPTTRPLSALSSLLTPFSTAAPSPATPRPVSLSCSRPYCNLVAKPAAGRCCRTVGRRLPSFVAMSSSAPPPPGSVQKSEEEWEAILTPEQFRILRLRAPSILEQVNMTSSSVTVFMNVLGAEPPRTNHLQSSTQGVVGQHSMKDFLEP